MILDYGIQERRSSGFKIEILTENVRKILTVKEFYLEHLSWDRTDS